MNLITEKFIAEQEGCNLKAVWDVNGWACGYGEHGDDIHEGTSWSQEYADARLALRVEKFRIAVDALVKTPINENQEAALTSLAYNIGAAALASSTLLRLLNSGDKFGAAAQFIRWDRSGGVELPGLAKRRHDEADLFLS